MKKTYITPPPSLNRKIKGTADQAYAESVNELPSEIKVHRSLFKAIATAACMCIVAAAVFVLALARPFAKAPSPADKIGAPSAPWYDLPVGDEPFESLPRVAPSGIPNHFTFTDEKSLFDEAEAVIIGFAENTFTDESQAYFNNEWQQVSDYNDAVIICTPRPVKVVECLKGELKEKDTLNIVSFSYVADGSIIEGKHGDFIQKQNVKYIFYLYKWGSDLDGNQLYAVRGIYDGCYNIDGLDTKHYSSARNITIHDMWDIYRDKFEKYDRTDEYPQKAHICRDYPVYDTAGDGNTEVFDCDKMATDNSELVIIAKPKHSMKDSERISLDPQKTVDEITGGYYAATLVEMDVKNTIKGDTDQKPIKVYTEYYWFFSPYTNTEELYSPMYKGTNTLFDQNSTYVLYLKKAPELGEGVYRLAGKDCAVIPQKDFAPFPEAFKNYFLYDVSVKYSDKIEG